MVDSVLAHGHVTDEVQARWEAALATSPDAAEGIAAFAERRTPTFQWAPPPHWAARGARPADLAASSVTEPADPTPIEVPVPVLGVDACGPGWIGALLAPGLPRPQLYAADTLAAIIETAMESWAVSVVAITQSTALTDADSNEVDAHEVQQWLDTRPRAHVLHVDPEESFADLGDGPIEAAPQTPEGVASRLAALARHGIARPSVLAGSGYAADDVLAACAAAWTAARFVTGGAL